MHVLLVQCRWNLLHHGKAKGSTSEWLTRSPWSQIFSVIGELLLKCKEKGVSIFAQSTLRGLIFELTLFFHDDELVLFALPHPSVQLLVSSSHTNTLSLSILVQYAYTSMWLRFRSFLLNQVDIYVHSQVLSCHTMEYMPLTAIHLYTRRNKKTLRLESMNSLAIWLVTLK